MGTWSLLQVKPNQEFKLADELWAHDIGYFLPHFIRKQYIGTEKRNVRCPLWPSYVFLRGSDYDVYQAKCTNRLVNVIPVALQSKLTQELSQVHQAIASGAEIGREPLQAGESVRVKAGPLMGVQGIAVSGDAKGRILLTCSMMGSAVSVSVDRNLLESVTQ